LQANTPGRKKTMDLHVFFICLFSTLALLMFFSDIFPKCSLCKRIKPRMFFRIHQRTGLLPGYRYSRSVCAGCCRKYDINGIKKLEQLRRIKNKVEMEVYLDKEIYKEKYMDKINKGCKLKE